MRDAFVRKHDFNWSFFERKFIVVYGDNHSITGTNSEQTQSIKSELLSAIEEFGHNVKRLKLTISVEAQKCANLRKAQN